MALTGAQANLVQKLYAKQLYKEARDLLFFNKFMGEKESDIIQTINDFKKEKGDQKTFGLGMDMTGTGVIGDNELEGNEEALVVYTDSVTIDQLRNAVRVPGRLEEQRASYSIRETGKERLKQWLQNIIDQKMFNHLCGVTTETFPATALAPDSGHVIYGGVATSDATIVSTDTFSATTLHKAREKALTLSPKLKPYQIKGGESTWIAIIHPYQAYDLRQDTEWQNAMYSAYERGMTNPIFTGSMGLMDGITVYVHPKIYTTGTWGAGSNVNGARALFLGQQAALFAVAAEPTWVEKDFDYANQTGIATGMIFGIKKTRFNGKDFGVISLDTAATSH